MQRGVAIVLSALFTWLMVLPLLLPSGESALRACCRKDGKHHCMMAAEQPEISDPAFTTIKAKCPCCPAATTATKAHMGTVSLYAAIFAGLVRHPAVSPQTEAGYRVSHHRARQKRGPPYSIAA